MPRLFAALLTALLLHGAAAGADTAERWYRVELVIFAHPDGLTAERWEAQPELDYPEAARFLLTLEDLRYLRDESVEADRSVPPENASPNVSAEPTANIEPGRQKPLPTAFLTLPRGQQELRDKVAYMRRAGGYRILLHEAWAQPVLKTSLAPSLVLDRSGEAQTWPELQGSIRLSLSRYLTLETNLWLNTAGHYLPGQWRMPPPPRGPGIRPGHSEEAPEVEASAEMLEPVVQAGEEQSLDGPGQDEALEYPYRHAVLLQQRRRMRSNELHYLDHPLLGLLIQLSPLTAEQLARMAESEAAAMRTP